MYVLDKEKLKEAYKECDAVQPKLVEIVKNINGIEDTAIRASLWFATVKYLSETVDLPSFMVVAGLELIKTEIEIKVLTLDQSLLKHIQYLIEEFTGKPQKGVQ